jgi:hypothetical protein
MTQTYDTLVLDLSKPIDASSDSGGSLQGTTKKKYHHKVRSGCLRCKNRKIKCDESRPECLRCRKSGYKCSGYKLPQPRLFELPLKSTIFANDRDKGAFDYFLGDGSYILSTFQPTSRMIWRSILPQLAHEHPAVKHGIIALGAIQEPLHHSSRESLLAVSRTGISEHALENFAKGLKYLSFSDPATISTEVSLICCLLFLAISIWQDRSTAPVLHVDAALRLLRDYHAGVAAKKRPRSGNVDNLLEPQFTNLVINTITFADAYPTVASQLTPDYEMEYGLNQAGSYSQMDDAFDALNNVTRCIVRMHAGNGTPEVARKAKVALAEFATSLERFKPQSLPFECTATFSEQEYHYKNLQVQHLFATLLLRAVNCPDETVYDEYSNDFLRIIMHSEQLIMYDLAATPYERLTLRTSMGFLAPLFFASTKCRNGPIRREALRVLHAALRNERVFTSCIAYQMAHCLINEEGQLESETEVEVVAPQDRVRIHSVELSKKEATMLLRFEKGLDRDTPLLYEKILPFKSHRTIEKDDEPMPIEKKILHAHGYTGIILFSPPIVCHCPDNT